MFKPLFIIFYNVLLIVLFHQIKAFIQWTNSLYFTVMIIYN